MLNSVTWGDKRIAKDWRRLGGVVDMQGGCLCLIVCPICLALSLLTTPPGLAASSFPSTSSCSCASLPHRQLTPSIVPWSVSPSPHAGRRPGVFNSQQLVALFACTTHICAQLPGCQQSIHSRRLWASAGTEGIKRKHIDTHQMAERLIGA